jgi:hypothetical protein
MDLLDCPEDHLAARPSPVELRRHHEIQKEIIGRGARPGCLTRTFMDPLLPVPNAMLDRLLELAASGLFMLGSGVLWRLPGYLLAEHD